MFTRLALLTYLILSMTAEDLAQQKTIATSCIGHEQADDADTIAWKLFACLNRSQHSATAEPKTLWQTWASPDDLYCNEAGHNCDASKKPHLPHRVAREGLIEPIRQERLLMKEFSGDSPLAKALQTQHFDGGQEVRLNRSVFKYVVDQNLWYFQGQQNAFLRPGEISFPIGSIEVKAHWIPIERVQRKRYLWRKDDQGNYFGLVAFNIAAKTQPQWFWATFEHVDNPKRCSFTKCSTGSLSGISGINDSVELPLSSNVRMLLRHAGLKLSVHSWWLNYRLHGTQGQFIDSDGPTLLGNSILEAVFTNHSSCITCHSRASRNYQGESLPIKKSDTELGFVGKPERSWFCDNTDKRVFLSLDYVWSLRRAQPARNLPSPTNTDISPKCGMFDWLPR